MPNKEKIIRSFFIQTQKCLILIGMPGSGKTTLGKAIASKLSWAHVDTDFIFQAWWGTDLETILKTIGLDGFLKAEEEIILSLKLNRCIISTGGSVVYSKKGMHYLQKLGYIIYLHANLKTLQDRIAKNPERGMIIKPNQNLEDLFNERSPLYERYAHFTISTEAPLNQNIKEIITWLSQQKNEKF
ncbi:shikimate kinase [Desulfonauticus submarinus]|uniref:Shikimate kinase n=1 Tax=Desulfonauticus submarinus TaxID=206665 RepID=A0A1H0D2I4_9BACT|nr:homoserine kinase [Desulfonauticus submarinus]SDN64382.1 shikimate kinase [Desulfonauticus submarinus]